MNERWITKMGYDIGVGIIIIGMAWCLGTWARRPKVVELPSAETTVSGFIGQAGSYAWSLPSGSELTSENGTGQLSLKNDVSGTLTIQADPVRGTIRSLPTGDVVVFNGTGWVSAALYTNNVVTLVPQRKVRTRTGASGHWVNLRFDDAHEWVFNGNVWTAQERPRK